MQPIKLLSQICSPSSNQTVSFLRFFSSSIIFFGPLTFLLCIIFVLLSPPISPRQLLCCACILVFRNFQPVAVVNLSYYTSLSLVVLSYLLHSTSTKIITIGSMLIRTHKYILISEPRGRPYRVISYFLAGLPDKYSNMSSAVM